MAYTPYPQALPDTTLYERLQGNYTPIRGRENPYDSSLFNTEYYKDPFGYTKKKLGFGPTLDETLGNKAAAVGLGGLFTPQASSGGGDSGNQENQRNYYQDLEDRYTELNISEDGMSPEDARAAAKASVFQEQSARNARLNAAMTLFGNAVMPGATAFGLAKYGPTGYVDYLQGNTRVMMGDTTGYQSPITRVQGQPAPAVVGNQSNFYTPSSLQETMSRTGGVLTPQQAQAVVNYVSSGDSGGGGGFGYGGQDGMGGQIDSALTGYTE